METHTLLAKIRKNPKSYLGEISLKRLSSYLYGYSIRRYELGKTELNSALDDFHTYVMKLYSDNSTFHFMTVISSNSNSEKEAFYKFYELYDEFFKKN